MNERIQELAEQAGFQRTKFGLVATPESNPVKFAELIVKDCINIAINYDKPKLHGPGLTIGMYIEAHFDVYVDEDGRFVK